MRLSERLASPLAINLATQGLGALMNLLFMPLVARALGLASFGIVGIASIVQLVVFAVDGCNLMTRLVAREAAAGVDDGLPALYVASESAYGVLTLLGLAVAAALGVTASLWLPASSTLSPALAGQCAALIAAGAFLKLLGSFYRGGLIGLERFATANLVSLAANVVKFPLAYGVVLLHPDVRLFLAIHLLAFLIEAGLLRTIAGRHVHLRYGGTALRRGWRLLAVDGTFIASTFFLATVSVLNNQLDKLILASRLPLRDYGAASLAIVVCMGLFVLATPIHQVYLPQLVRGRVENGLLRSNSARGLHLILLMVCLPALAVFLSCANALATLVSGAPDPTIADAFSLYGAGNCVAVAATGLYLQFFASGRLGAYTRTICLYLALYAPLLMYAAARHGLHGAGSAWVAGNVALYAALAWQLVARGEIDAALGRVLRRAAGLAAAAVAIGLALRPIVPTSIVAGGAVALVVLGATAAAGWRLLSSRAALVEVAA